MTNKDQNTYISTYMKHKNIFQNRLKSYSEKIHFFSDQTLDIYKFLNTMTFLSVNHNSLYTILGTYPPGPFRNNHNSPKKISIFPAFPATLFQRGNFQHAKFFQRGKFAGKANCRLITLKQHDDHRHPVDSDVLGPQVLHHKGMEE